VSHNTIGSLFGRKGSGKSTLVGEITRDFRRVIVIDYLGEYDARRGFTVHEGFTASATALVRWNPKPRFALSLRVDEVHHALMLLEIVWEMRNVLLVVEESSWLCTPSNLPQELRRLVRMGRHREISQLYVAQRPAMVHRDVTSQSDWIVSFQQHEARDIHFLEESLLGEQAEKVRELGQYEIIAGTASGSPAQLPAAVRARLRSSDRAKGVDDRH